MKSGKLAGANALSRRDATLKGTVIVFITNF